MQARLRNGVKWLAAVTTAGMFIVLVMGSTVTNTGSAAGCGADWPLCNGQFIPEFAVHTAIEFSHRAVTGLEGLLIVATSIGVLLFWRQRREAQVLVPLMIFFLFLQAGLGALAVMYSTSSTILALHFGISLLAFASILLTTLLIWQIDNGVDALRDRPLPSGARWAIWGLSVYTYGVVYLGAYVNHTNASLACLDWPLCQGSVFPGFTGPVGIVFSHRLAAAILTLGIGGLVAWCWRERVRRPDLYWTGLIAIVTLLSQSAAGAAVVFSRVNLFSALAHGAIVTLFFGAMTYLCLHSLPRPRAIRQQAGSVAPEPGPPVYAPRVTRVGV